MKVDLDKIQKLAEKASDNWLKYSRECDYVDFGPVYSHKDNGEGNDNDYKLIAYLSPERVLELVKMARPDAGH